MYARWYFVDAEIAECLQQSLRRKGRMPSHKHRDSAREIQKDFRYIVETDVRRGGFGNRWMLCTNSTLVTGVRAINSTGWRDENSGYYVRWCFVDPAIAAAFAKEFGA